MSVGAGSGDDFDPDDDGDGGIDVGAIIDEVIDAVMSMVWGLFRDLFTGFYIIPLAMVGLTAWIFLGSDRSVQRTVEGFPGLADLPVFIANILVGAIEPIASMILTSIAGMNLTLVSAVVGETSILAVPLLFILQTVEIGVLVYSLWAGAQFASAVPVVGPALEAGGAVVTKPFRAMLGVIR